MGKKTSIPGVAVCLACAVLASCVMSWNRRPGPDQDGETDGSGEWGDMFEDVRCDPGLTACAGTCVDVRTSHSHCGSCFNECPAAEVCNDGECTLECPSSKTACYGGCVDVRSDIHNCGGCGSTCSAGLNAQPVCEGGICGVVCDPGWSDLDGDGTCESDCVPSSPTESCNGIDDNCDGQIDEGLECRMGQVVGCTTVCGSIGTVTCGMDCRIPPASQCNPPGESCNGLDDDCDGTCDNGFGCCNGILEACTTSCGSAGSRTCSSSCAWGNCTPPFETCNGADDDCNGACDDGVGMACCSGQSGSCTTSCGTTGTRTCLATCVWGTCAPPPETCNGIDDDCDGGIDEDFEDPYEGSGGDTCESAVDLGTVRDSESGSITVNAGILGPDDHDWFIVRAEDDGDSSGDEFNFEAYWATNPGGLVFDVYQGGCGTQLCGGVGDCANWYTDFYNGSSGENPCRPASTPGFNLCNDNTQSFIIHVYRSSGSGFCASYSIVVRNNPPGPGPGCVHP
jgi:hypothetical protein